MQNLEKQVANRLTGLYIIALSAVALLSFVGQILIQNSLTGSLDDAHVVNLAGRQRMLSQRLCKTVILLTNPEIHSPDAEYYYNDIKTILPLWKKYHEGLRDGFLIDSTKTFQVKNSAEINQLFNQLEIPFQKIYSSAEIISNHSHQPNDNSENIKKSSLREILSYERSFLLIMDKIVRQYDLEATERVNRVKTIELFLFLLTAGVLILEFILIFLPLAKYVKDVIKKITESENQLQIRNQELSITNQKLIDTQADLLRTTEEKYELIRQEDNIRSSSLMQGQEEERRRLSLELHDGIGQMLTGLKLHSEKLKDLPFLNEKQQKTFDDHKKLIEETIETTRMVSFNLMPSVLTDFGLCAAVKHLATYTHKTSDLSVKFEENLKEFRLSRNLEVNLYRVIQEAINNTIKHAKATKIEIVLTKKGKHILISIVDDGKGFNTKIIKNQDIIKNGLANIQTRIRLIGGSVVILSEINKGTAINIKIPL